MELKNLFSPGRIGNIQIKNRIVRSATYEGRANRGNVTDDQIDFYVELAEGGAGLIITGATLSEISGSGGITQPYLCDDSFIPGQKRLVEAVHEYADVKIGVQLVHMGRNTVHPKYPPVAPSAVPNEYIKRTPKELTIKEIEYQINAFVSAGRRAYDCGYDIIQLHGAHDYFLSNFISPFTNRRTDDYGGTTEKRTKILVDIYNLLREELGKEIPITIKLQTIDGFSVPLTLEEGKNVAQILVNKGFDAIEPSGGTGQDMFSGKKIGPSNNIKSPEDENFFLENVKALKKIENCCPIIMVGGIRNPLSAEKILQEKHADFISLSRPLIYEPDLPNRWESGDIMPAKCISCNSCYMTMLKGPIYCVVRKKRERRERKKKVT